MTVEVVTNGHLHFFDHLSLSMSFDMKKNCF